MKSLKKNYITNIQKFSVHDGQGIRTNVFLKGCCLKCKWCANPEGISGCRELLCQKRKCLLCQKCTEACPNHALHMTGNGIEIDRTRCQKCGICLKVCPGTALEISGKPMTTDEVFKVINEDKVFYQTSGGGVTFSGGEPMLHPAFVGEVAARCKAEGYSVAAETCGFFHLEEVLPIIDLFDMLLFDIKIIDDEKHQFYCGESNQVIHHNFNVLIDKVPITARIPIIPTVNDTPEDIDDFCRFFSNYKGRLKTIHILPYHTLGLSKYAALQKPYELPDLGTPSDRHMEDIKETLCGCGFDVLIGG